MRLIDFHISSRVRYKRRDNKTLVNAGLLEMLNSTGKMRHCIFLCSFLISSYFITEMHISILKKNQIWVWGENLISSKMTRKFHNRFTR